MPRIANFIHRLVAMTGEKKRALDWKCQLLLLACLLACLLSTDNRQGKKKEPIALPKARKTEILPVRSQYISLGALLYAPKNVGSLWRACTGGVVVLLHSIEAQHSEARTWIQARL